MMGVLEIKWLKITARIVKSSLMGAYWTYFQMRICGLMRKVEMADLQAHNASHCDVL